LPNALSEQQTIRGFVFSRARVVESDVSDAIAAQIVEDCVRNSDQSMKDGFAFDRSKVQRHALLVPIE
jgi:hypothetical protein